MAQRTGRRWSVPLGIWIFLIIALLVLLTAGGSLLATSILGERFARRSTAKALDANHSLRTVLQQQRYRQLQLISRIFATDRLLTAYLAEAAEARDPVLILDALEEYQNLLSFDLAVVLDEGARVLARTDDPEAVGEDLSGNPLVAAALEEKQAFGVWADDGSLHHAAALPLVRNFEQLGYIVVAFAIDDALARQIQRISDADTLFLVNSPTGPAVAASTLAPAAAAELISSLRLQGDVLGRVTLRGETADQVRVSLQGRDGIAFLTPLADAAGAPVGAAVALTSYEERLADHRQLQLLLAGLGGGALIAGLLFSQMLSARTAKPLERLAEASRRAAHGDFSATVPAGGSGTVGQLGESLGALFGDLGAKQALEQFVSRVHRFLPEPAKAAGAGRPQSREAVLLAVEMRRFADPKIGFDPEESLGRMSRDLRRLAAAVTSRTGWLVSVFGHRALAVFEGDGAALSALGASAEILHELSQRENVFDEPSPPVVALADGPVITGPVVWGDQPSSAVAGLPIQQLESLLREATPGEIYLAKSLQARLAETFQRAGVEVQAQRGLLSPQPLYVVSGELAARLTGFVPAAEEAAAFGDERRDLADVRAGTVLGGRYEILAELGVGHAGPLFKARDRDLGDLVTLKMLKPELVADPARFQQLQRVAQLGRSLRHPHVLAVLDFAEADGLPYLATEYVRGLTLRYLLDHGGRMGTAAGLYLARQLSQGLQAAHDEGLLHLDIKPENVLVEAGGHARWMDFGQSPLARSSVPAASVPYLAPEQLEGRGGDARTDVYAFGAVLYEAFTAKVPYPASSPAELRQQLLMQDAAPPSSLAAEVTPQLDQLILRCLAKAPEARYGSVSELLEDLDAAREGFG